MEILGRQRRTSFTSHIRRFVLGQRRNEKRETPSLSLRLRLVQYTGDGSDATRTLSDKVRQRSVRVSDLFESIDRLLWLRTAVSRPNWANSRS